MKGISFCQLCLAAQKNTQYKIHTHTHTFSLSTSCTHTNAALSFYFFLSLSLSHTQIHTHTHTHREDLFLIALMGKQLKRKRVKSNFALCPILEKWLKSAH